MTRPLSALLVLRRRPVFLAGAAILLLVLASWLLRPRPSQGSTAFFEVRRGDFTVSIVEGGTLAAVSEVSVRNEVEGTARIIYIVPEGTYVKKDDLLIELDSAQAQDQVNQQQIALEKAQFALIQAEAQLDIQRSTTNSDIRAAQLKYDLALLDLERFRQGKRLVDLIEATNKLVQVEAQLAVNRETFTNTLKLAARGFEAQNRVDSDRLAVLGNENNLIIESNKMWMLTAFEHKKQSAEFQSAVDQSKMELERVVAQSQRRIAQYVADLLTQSNTLVLNQRKLDRDRKNLDATKIFAPQDGLVVYNVSENRFSSESLIEEGATVRNRQELIKLPDVSHMKVTIKVHESYVNMISPGLPAFVILDSMPDQRFAGYVAKVALLPDSQARWGNPNLKVYNTEVYITDDLPDVKPGVSAKAEVIITNLSDTLSVPIQAVTTSRGRQVVYIDSGSEPEPRPVEVGLYNTKYIQITSGLKEGDRVLLAPPFDTQEKDLEGAVLSPEEKAKLKTNNPAMRNLPVAPRRPSDGRPEGRNPSGPHSSATPTPDAPARIPSPAAATANSRTPGGPGTDGPTVNRNPPNREEMLKRFDKDGDGELSETEREAMRSQFGGSRTNRGDRSRGGGNGRPNNEGRRGNRSAEAGGESRPPRTSE